MPQLAGRQRGEDLGLLRLRAVAAEPQHERMSIVYNNNATAATTTTTTTATTTTNNNNNT